MSVLGCHRFDTHVAGALVAVLVLCADVAGAASVRAGFSETIVASGLVAPTAMAFAPDGRIFVCQQGGSLRVIKDGVLLPAPFLTVTVSSLGERGLLGVAFDPEFETNHYVYVYYTATLPNIHNRVSRFTANGDVAVAGSEVTILDVNPLSGATNHNGGALHFGPDGLLYIGVGENAQGSNSQSLGNLLGKILRINRDGSIPVGNPFYNQTTGVNRAIWALGLRNPFTFAIEAVSGRMMINDVGQDLWEEVNVGVQGANYGWPETEGPTTDPRFVSPVLAYSHAVGCAISGAAFYPVASSQYPAEYAGDYFFADFCAGWIRQYDFASGPAANDFVSGLVAVVDLAIGPDGSLYYVDRGKGGSTGVVGRIEFAGQRPRITLQPAPATVASGANATFRVMAAGTGPLSYQWQRDGVDIPGATSAIYTLTAARRADNGARFRCRVSNPSGEVTSNEAPLTVVVGRLPVPNILTPASSTQYVAGTLVSYSGRAVDADDGMLPASRLTWEIVFHHDTHTHPFVPPRSGELRGTFTIPNEGETSTNVWYRIRLTATDSDGQQATTFRDVRPKVTRLSLTSNPRGLTLTLDGQPVTTPYVFSSVAGMRRTIGVVAQQSLNRFTYEFHSWSDGGASTRVVTTPASSRIFTAAFRRISAPVRQPDRCPDTTSAGCPGSAPRDAPAPPPGSREPVPRTEPRRVRRRVHE